jgi:hypothetical protein
MKRLHDNAMKERAKDKAAIAAVKGTSQSAFEAAPWIRRGWWNCRTTMQDQ